MWLFKTQVYFSKKFILGMTLSYRNVFPGNPEKVFRCEESSFYSVDRESCICSQAACRRLNEEPMASQGQGNISASRRQRPRVEVPGGVEVGRWMLTKSTSSAEARFRFETCLSHLLGAPLVAQIVKNLPAMQGTPFQSLGQEDPLEKRMATHTVFLPGESHGQRSLVS